MIEIPFPYQPPFLKGELENNQYRIFSELYENDQTIAFHGTNYLSFKAIDMGGFKIPNNPPSISLSEKSNCALKYACDKRYADYCGVVLAVDISAYKVVNEGDSYQRQDGELPIVKSGNAYHLYKYEDKLDIIAYCLIPKEYQHT
jgi:hypothetical protein